MPEFIGWPTEGVEYWNAFWRGHADEIEPEPDLTYED